MKKLITLLLILGSFQISNHAQTVTVKPLSSKVRLVNAIIRDTVARDSIVILKARINQLQSDMDDSISYLRGILMGLSEFHGDCNIHHQEV
jgi:hypothetical protein